MVGKEFDGQSSDRNADNRFTGDVCGLVGAGDSAITGRQNLSDALKRRDQTVWQGRQRLSSDKIPLEPLDIAKFLTETSQQWPTEMNLWIGHLESMEYEDCDTELDTIVPKAELMFRGVCECPIAEGDGFSVVHLTDEVPRAQ